MFVTILYLIPWYKLDTENIEAQSQCSSTSCQQACSRNVRNSGYFLFITAMTLQNVILWPCLEYMWCLDYCSWNHWVLWGILSVFMELFCLFHTNRLNTLYSAAHFSILFQKKNTAVLHVVYFCHWDTGSMHISKWVYQRCLKSCHQSI